MKFSNIQHIYFDLDHTLWDFDKNSALTFEVIFKKEKLEIDLACFLKAYVPINENYWRLYREDQISKESLRTGRLKDCFEVLNVPVTPVTIENLSNRYIEFLPGFSNLLEDTIEVLQYLTSKYKLHIITNGFEEVQNTKLVNSQISEFFNTVTTSEEAGVKKPHPLIFNKAMEKSNASPANSLMIGDSYEADILGAQRAGMQSLFFDYYRKEPDSQTPRIQKLKELLDCL
ncbi:noncanonical pyrimidine nucleotidase, YjjG family [Antarcticibacterium arcticum]|uniref:Noncanonical pyrimidine nucleotidase, YjjG family n=1 Tax=Antarcticibacterium arcticum TaxID=2585771 RepID=A0A5B8YPL9_9FLAO|nr:YjjG family noncanonical pyrimidine nucleotidase [Antarcticibacterium arcticum]QED38847.1 noncanonical pyrimidine nucleotidase, YjjG family [Antarcticibacterium arcticum]